MLNWDIDFFNVESKMFNWQLDSKNLLGQRNKLNRRFNIQLVRLTVYILWIYMSIEHSPNLLSRLEIDICLIEYFLFNNKHNFSIVWSCLILDNVHVSLRLTKFNWQVNSRNVESLIQLVQSKIEHLHVDCTMSMLNQRFNYVDFQSTQ